MRNNGGRSMAMAAASSKSETSSGYRYHNSAIMVGKQQIMAA